MSTLFKIRGCLHVIVLNNLNKTVVFEDSINPSQETNCYFRPPTKLREGNVFTGVCLSVGRGDPHVTITDDALDLTVQVPHPLSLPDIRLGTPLTSDLGPPASDIW